MDQPDPLAVEERLVGHQVEVRIEPEGEAEEDHGPRLRNPREGLPEGERPSRLLQALAPGLGAVSDRKQDHGECQHAGEHDAAPGRG